MHSAPLLGEEEEEDPRMNQAFTHAPGPASVHSKTIFNYVRFPPAVSSRTRVSARMKSPLGHFSSSVSVGSLAIRGPRYEPVSVSATVRGQKRLGARLEGLQCHEEMCSTHRQIPVILNTR